jgi:DNA-binding MarR family transcriptional regulator
MLSTKVQILKGKFKKIIESEEEAKKDFLAIIACHNGSVRPESIPVSFKKFKEKYGEEKFNEVRDYLFEEGIIFIPTSHYKPIQFLVKDEKGEYDSKSGEELSKYFGKMIFEHKLEIRETIEEILQDEEGREFLKYIAKHRDIFIRDGIEPKIKEMIGKRNYDIIVNKMLEVGILNEYLFFTTKHVRKGYLLLPFIDDFIKSRLGLFELEDNEKIVLAYIGYMNKIFSFPTKWYISFNHPTEYEHEILSTWELAQKFLANIIYQNLEDIKKIVEKLQNQGLIQQVDLGYTRAGHHRGRVLELSQSAHEIIKQEENILIEKVKNEINEIFSEKDNRIVYYLFSKEKFPLKLLLLINRYSVDILVRKGIISDNVSLQFNKEIYDICAEIETNEIKKWLMEKCEGLLSRDERLFIGFLSDCKNVILDKCPDWKLWSSVSSRTQRNYQIAYDALIINFPYLKRLFSKLTGMSIERVDEIALSLEEKGFLIKQRDDRCGFPGYALIYRIPVKIDFNFDFSIIKSKIKEYIQFLAKNIDNNYNQLIFLDYLIRFYEIHQCNLLIDSSLIKEQLLKPLNYTPPAEYSPIYAFENGVIILHPIIKEEVKNEIYELKIKLIEPLKNIFQELTKDYQGNIAYNYSENIKREGYLLIEIESPDPSIGIVSFIIMPWVIPLYIQEISSLCTKSSTVNLFTFYPNYPSIKSMITTDGRYNLIIIRNTEAHLFLNRVDKLTQTVFEMLSKHFKLLEQEEEIKPEIDELQKEYPNLSKVRFIIPEAEDLLRNAIRPYLIKELGDTWQEKIKQYFPKAEERKQKWEKEHHENTDILQGLSLGDLLTLFENKSFSFIKDCFKDFPLAESSIKIFLRKKEYHHGKPKNGKDISNDEVNLINIAFINLKEMIKRY